MGKAILGFIAIWLIWLTISVGAPMVAVWGELFKLALLVVALTAIGVASFAVFHFVGRTICWIFRGFKDFWD